MRRTFGLIALAITMGTAPAALAQAQQNLQNGNASDYRRSETPMPRIVADEAYAEAAAALKAKRYREAAYALAPLARAEPNKAETWRLLGVAYAGDMRWVASRRAYKRALDLAPDDVASHAGLGLALLALNDPRAQDEAEWLKAKAQACKDTCPEAPVLKALEANGPFAAPPSSMD